MDYYALKNDAAMYYRGLLNSNASEQDIRIAKLLMTICEDVTSRAVTSFDVAFDDELFELNSTDEVEVALLIEELGYEIP